MRVYTTLAIISERQRTQLRCVLLEKQVSISMF